MHTHYLHPVHTQPTPSVKHTCAVLQMAEAISRDLFVSFTMAALVTRAVLLKAKLVSTLTGAVLP